MIHDQENRYQPPGVPLEDSNLEGVNGENPITGAFLGILSGVIVGGLVLVGTAYVAARSIPTGFAIVALTTGLLILAWSKWRKWSKRSTAFDFLFLATLTIFQAASFAAVQLESQVGKRVRAGSHASVPGLSNHSMHQTLPLRGIAGDFES